MPAFVRRHPLASYVVLAYALSWSAWIPLFLRHARVVPGGTVTHFPGLLGPALAAFAVVAVTEGRAGVRALLRRTVLIARPSSRFLVYALSPLAFLAAALLALRLSGRPGPPLTDFALYSGLPALPLGIVLLLVFLVNGFGEETGWRGFALERFQARFGPVAGTLVLGLVWAGWHTPLFWVVEGYRALNAATIVFGFGLGICAGSVVLARVVNRTGGSVLAAALWHTTYNMTSATVAGRGTIGAVVTTCIMVWAGVLLLLEWRRPVVRSRLAVR